MIKKVIFLFFVLFSFHVVSQNKTGSDNIESVVYCLENGKYVKRENVILNPSKKLVTKIQGQLKYLGYEIVPTGQFDYQTKQILKSFNNQNGLGDVSYLFKETVSILKSKYKLKRKGNN